MKEIKIYEIPNIDSIERIDDPYIGMIIYVANIDAYYSVKTLKEINGVSTKGNKIIEYVIDEYLDFGSGGGGGTGLTPTQLSNIAKIPAIQSTVDALPNNYASKNHNHSEYASSSHRHDASEIDNLPSGGGTGLTSEQTQQLQTAYEHSQIDHVQASDIPSLEGYATETFVTNKIAEAQLSSGEVDLSGYATKTELNNKADKTAIPTKVSQLENDSNYLKSTDTIDADSLNGKKFSEPMTKQDYDAIEDIDPNTIYLIEDDTAIEGGNFGEIILTSADGGKYKLIVGNDGSLTTQKIVIYGNIVVSTTELGVTEGSNGTFTIALESAPNSNQVVTISSNNTDVTANPSSLTFTTDNYSAAQTVTLTAAEDSDYDNDTAVITVSSTGVTSKTVTVTVTDNDTELTGITLPITESVTIAGNVTLTPMYEPVNTTETGVTWSVTPEGIATVENGVVHGVTSGECVVTATSTIHTNISASCTITVSAQADIPLPEYYLLTRYRSNATDGEATLITNEARFKNEVTWYDNDTNAQVMTSSTNSVILPKPDTIYKAVIPITNKDNQAINYFIMGTPNLIEIIDGKVRNLTRPSVRFLFNNSNLTSINMDINGSPLTDTEQSISSNGKLESLYLGDTSGIHMPKVFSDNGNKLVNVDPTELWERAKPYLYGYTNLFANFTNLKAKYPDIPESWGGNKVITPTAVDIVDDNGKSITTDITTNTDFTIYAVTTPHYGKLYGYTSDNWEAVVIDSFIGKPLLMGGGDATIAITSDNNTSGSIVIHNTKGTPSIAPGYIYKDGNQYTDVTGGWTGTNSIIGETTMVINHGTSSNVITANEFTLNAGDAVVVKLTAVDKASSQGLSIYCGATKIDPDCIAINAYPIIQNSGSFYMVRKTTTSVTGQIKIQNYLGNWTISEVYIARAGA